MKNLIILIVILIPLGVIILLNSTSPEEKRLERYELAKQGLIEPEFVFTRKGEPIVTYGEWEHHSWTGNVKLGATSSFRLHQNPKKYVNLPSEGVYKKYFTDQIHYDNKDNFQKLNRIVSQSGVRVSDDNMLHIQWSESVQKKLNELSTRSSDDKYYLEIVKRTKTTKYLLDWKWNVDGKGHVVKDERHYLEIEEEYELFVTDNNQSKKGQIQFSLNRFIDGK